MWVVVFALGGYLPEVYGSDAVALAELALKLAQL